MVCLYAAYDGGALEPRVGGGMLLSAEDNDPLLVFGFGVSIFIGNTFCPSELSISALICYMVCCGGWEDTYSLSVACMFTGDTRTFTTHPH